MDLKAIFHINYIVIMQYITNMGNNNWKKPTQTDQNTVQRKKVLVHGWNGENLL
jgi:hypothetical protein